MELRRLTLCLPLVLLAVFSHCSEARHAIHRRGTEGVNYDDPLLADEANDDDEAQNDDGGNDADEDVAVNATIVSLPNDYIVSVGTSVRLECRVTPSDGVVVAWIKDGEQYFIGSSKLKAPDRFSIAPGSLDLLIKDLEPSDTGRYKCEIMQEPPVSIEHTVGVMEAPRIIRFSAANDRLTEGQDMLLTCDAVGSPKPEILWSRVVNGGTEKLTEKDGEFSSNTFFARNVRREMSGRYLCYAINSVNSSQANLVVTVSGKPRVHVHRTIINSDIGVEAVLMCSANEEPAPYIRWYKDGRLIEDSSTQYSVRTSGSSSNLTVTPEVDQDFGTFTCEAENYHGKHNRSIELVQSPVVENLDYEDLKLSWRVHSHQPLEDMEVQLRSLNAEAEWTTLKVPLPAGGPEKKHEYEIIYVLGDKHLESGKYEATVKVKNQKSWSTHIQPAVFDIENQPQPIQTASVFRGNDAHSIRPTTTILSTVLMYLLVRML